MTTTDGTDVPPGVPVEDFLQLLAAGRAHGSITGDGEFAGCGHSVGGGGPGSAGAGHIPIDITAAHIESAGPDDPNPGGHVFYVDHNVVTFFGYGGSQTVVDDPDFLDDTQIPVEPGHYSFHPAPGVADSIQVAFRPAR